jgi:hypothetical protein
VSNGSDAIKIACDFLSIESLIASRQLAEEFRVQRLVHKWPEDVLQLDVTLWHAWNSLRKLQVVVTERELVLSPQPTLGSDTITDTLPATTYAMVDSVIDNDTLLKEKKRQKRNDRRRAKAAANRPHKQGHDCCCPCCPGFFNKRGVLMHMSVTSMSSCWCNWLKDLSSKSAHAISLDEATRLTLLQLDVDSLNVRILDLVPH